MNLLSRLHAGGVFFAFCGVLAGLDQHAFAAADFQVTTPGGQYFFVINGKTNPVLTLVRGKTYTFAVTNSSVHPFVINSSGVLSNNNTYHNVIGYTVPNVASNYNYYCSIHFFGAQIQTVAPPAPAVRILDLSLGTNITLHSTGTNAWSVQPQFSTNLSSTNWYALTVQTNRYVNGTNETICGRPPGSTVFLRLQEQPN